MNKNRHIALIIVASLGYFVDIYDLILFNVVKKESLEFLFPAYDSRTINDIAIQLFNWQMTGMMIGGLIWGILGDKKGRLSVLFGSILMYSLANIVNAFTVDVTTYAIVRFIAGVGLAGELGAGITLVAETMTKENRGYGTMIIVTFGALGAVAAAMIGNQGSIWAQWIDANLGIMLQGWQIAYIVGGIMGILLLILRISTYESTMFLKITQLQNVQKGNFFMLFNNWQRFKKYLYCILTGVPIWYVIGLLVANSQAIFAPDLNIRGEVNNGVALMYSYIGLSVGDLISGLLSQWMKSRKKVVIIYLLFTLALTIYFLFFMREATSDLYYIVCFLLGVATGYWAIFVTVASEQFGTNIRSTVTNTVPNFVRGSVPLIMWIFGISMHWLNNSIISAFIVGLICIGSAFYSAIHLDETFGKDLNYIEK